MADHAAQPIDFLSIVEFRDKPVVGPFFRAMNCTLPRPPPPRPGRRPRTVLDRLRAGPRRRPLPRGQHPPARDASVTAGGSFNPGVVQACHTLSRCPIVPVVILGTAKFYSKFAATYRYAPPDSASPSSGRSSPPIPLPAVIELAGAFVTLHDELRAAMAAQDGRRLAVALKGHAPGLRRVPLRGHRSAAFIAAPSVGPCIRTATPPRARLGSR